MPVSGFFTGFLGIGSHANELVGHFMIDDPPPLTSRLGHEATKVIAPSAWRANVRDFVTAHAVTLATTHMQWKD
ncbi:hypothetical protein [Aurantimicrobium minutum]|uniref:hypothetical protein n=1 Tax=Aurantimicrobium minutum TaxID=708131 RepID=UPI001E652134|nr:hypothetical protein [Aurantimicrobium minutum]